MHLGGMTDPLPPIERKLGVTKSVLEIARSFDQPVVLSTKSKLVATDEIVRVLEGGPFVVQISLGTTDDIFARDVDKGAPSPTDRLHSMKVLAASGVKVACRIQPVFPGRESEVVELIEACAAVGVSHVAVEHLKVPLERDWEHRGAMDRALGFDVVEYYRSHGALRVGREWILPVEQRLPAMLKYRSLAHEKGLFFGAADNDLLHFSDGGVCCSGSDLLGLGDGFRYNYLEAIRRRNNQSVITLASLDDVWRPVGSVSQYVNSSSRIPGASMGVYIEANWNSGAHDSSIRSFYGVSALDEDDSNGFRKYRLDDSVDKMIASSLRSR